MPEKKDERLTNNKKGKVILVSSTARLNFCASFLKNLVQLNKLNKV